VLEFPQRISEAVQLSDRVVLLLDEEDFEEGDEMVGRNVLCIGETGDVLWRIVPASAKATEHDPEWAAPEPYDDVWQDPETEKLKVRVPDITFDLDPETGEISNLHYER
jgi:hypothetical protein